MQDRYLRVAFSGVDADGIDELFSEIAAAARELGTGSEKAVGKA